MLKEIEEFGGNENAVSLNSTIFLYGETSTNIAVETTAQFEGECITGDFNADGKTDILANTSYYNNLIKYSSGYKIMLDPQSSTTFYEKTYPPGHTITESKKFANFMASDYNRDGRDDVINIKTNYITNPSGSSWRKLEGITIEYTTNTGSFTNVFPIPVRRRVHTSGNFFIPGDFDGDSNQDYITILGNETGASNYYGFICTPSGYIANTAIGGLGTAPSSTTLNWPQIAAADKILPFDFDGDGKQELLVVSGSQTYILSITSQNSGGPSVSYWASIILTTAEISSSDKIFSGDFNGDRKSDLLIKRTTGQWVILNSNGLSFNSSIFSFNQSVVLNGNNADHKIVVADFNGDGKSDILHGYPIWVGITSTSSKFSMYYSRGTNSPFYYEQNDYNSTLPLIDLVTGDFNGDGSSDILLKGISTYTSGDIIYFKPKSQERILQKITTGHNVTTTLTHKLMTKDVYPYVYNRIADLDASSNQAPFNYIQLPMYLVASISNPDGIGGNSITEYSYQDAVMHRLGKGFLGFKKIVTKNNVIGNTSVTENEFNTQFALPYTVRQTLSNTSTQQLLSETLITNSFQNLSSGNLDKRYFQKVDKTVSIDYLNDKASESINTYDNYGNVINNIQKAGILLGNTVVPTETMIISSSFTIININLNIPTHVAQITTTKTRTGMPAVSAATIFSYNSKGLRTYETSFIGLPKAVTTFYNYNNFGNPISISTNATGVNGRYATTTYDAKGRFVISKSNVGSSSSQTESFVNSSKFGSVLQHTTSDCLTFNYEYDAFGKLFKSILPDGNIGVISHNWQTLDLFGSPNPNRLYYTFSHFSGGKPDTKVYTNKFGQEWRQETVSMYGPSASWHTMSTTYDKRGNIKTKTNIYFPAIPPYVGGNPPPPPLYPQPVETPRITIYNYDLINRVSSISNDVGNIMYNYSLLGNGKSEIAITNLDNQTTSQIIDETGKIVSTLDNGGRLDFFYDSRGNQIDVKRAGTSLVNSVFDEYGKQISVTDINAGTTTYTFDAYGQLIEQTDALGHIQSMAYDYLGRIFLRIAEEGVTSYEYYNDAATGCNNNNLSKVIGFNGVTKEFTFDALKRLSTETQTVEGVSSTKQFFYNSFGQINQTIYPSGLVLWQAYDASGYLTNVNHTSLASKNSIFKNGWVDGEGKYLTYALGLSVATNNTYNKDFISNTVTPGIRNLSYNFDLNTGNLMQRSNNLISQIENFSFDNLRRLNTCNSNNALQSSITYDATGTISMGNILTKTDAGYYKYKNDKINALAYIMNTPVPGQQPVTPIPNSVIDYSTQEITYTPFLKAETIGESANTGGPFLTYTYGPDCQRVKSHLTYGRGNYETKSYFGDYEKQEKNGVSREIHYVSGGNGLCAIIVKEAGVFTTNIVYTDHLGSITTVTNVNGSAIIAEQSFDAWGRKRNPNNWNDYNYNAGITAPSWLYRGYTGHEMLPEFSLINMNGRIYDPITARMLTPDILIPAAYNTQGYNRYTYAYNNPLSYTDPDGNEPITVAIIVGAVVGAYLGGTIANGSYNPLKWSANAKTLGYVVGGAVIGAFSGYIGGAVAASGMPFANTAGIIASSYVNSVGMNILTGGQVPVSVSFGFASYNLQTGDVGYLGEKGNSTMATVGFVFGALANLQDLVALGNGINATAEAEKGSVPHMRVRGEYTETVNGVEETTKIDISVAHGQTPPGAYKYDGPSDILNTLDYAQYWLTHTMKGKYMAYDPKVSAWKVTLNNVNGKVLSKISERIAKGNPKFGFGQFKYGTPAFGCHGHVAQALWRVGVPTLPINLFPAMLYTQLGLRQIGIFASPFLISR
jgi:RHS repeat-associated protein